MENVGAKLSIAEAFKALGVLAVLKGHTPEASPHIGQHFRCKSCDYLLYGITHDRHLVYFRMLSDCGHQEPLWIVGDTFLKDFNTLYEGDWR